VNHESWWKRCHKFGLAHCTTCVGGWAAAACKPRPALLIPGDAGLGEAARQPAAGHTRNCQLGQLATRLATAHMEIRASAICFGVERAGQMETIGFTIPLHGDAAGIPSPSRAGHSGVGRRPRSTLTESPPQSRASWITEADREDFWAAYRAAAALRRQGRMLGARRRLDRPHTAPAGAVNSLLLQHDERNFDSPSAFAASRISNPRKPQSGARNPDGKKTGLSAPCPCAQGCSKTTCMARPGADMHQTYRHAANPLKSCR